MSETQLNKHEVILYVSDDCFHSLSDVEPGVDEKGGAKMLEQSTEDTNYCCIFTVVPNAFIGLECSEHTCYDLIIAKKDMQHLGATNMLGVLHAVGSPTPVVLLLDELDNTNDYDAHSLGFFSVLRKPLSTRVLCNLIEAVMNRHAPANSIPSSSVTNAPDSSSSHNYHCHSAAATAISTKPASLHSDSHQKISSSTKNLKGSKEKNKTSEKSRGNTQRKSAANNIKHVGVDYSGGTNNENSEAIPSTDRLKTATASHAEGPRSYPTFAALGSSTSTSSSSSSSSSLFPVNRPRISSPMSVNEFSYLDDELLQLDTMRTSSSHSKSAADVYSQNQVQSQNQMQSNVGHMCTYRGPTHGQAFSADSRHNANQMTQHYGVKNHTQLSEADNAIHTFTTNTRRSLSKEDICSTTKNSLDIVENQINAENLNLWTQNQNCGIQSNHAATRKTDLLSKSSGVNSSNSDTSESAANVNINSFLKMGVAWDPRVAAEQLVKEWSTAKKNTRDSSMYPLMKAMETAMPTAEHNSRASGMATFHNFLNQPIGSNCSTSHTYLLAEVAANHALQLPSFNTHLHYSSDNIHSNTGDIASGSVGAVTGLGSGNGVSEHDRYVETNMFGSSRGSNGNNDGYFLSPSPSPSMFNYSYLSNGTDRTPISHPIPHLRNGIPPTQPQTSNSTTMGSTSTTTTKSSLREKSSDCEVSHQANRENLLQSQRHSSESRRKRAPSDQGEYDIFPER